MLVNIALSYLRAGLTESQVYDGRIAEPITITLHIFVLMLRDRLWNLILHAFVYEGLG